ncbi:hypothetical protein [Pseudomonas sp. NA-150]|uniref:hypothetical protein n=1 Tax=Pseudomonas sp. NA-150 TaxID=3367525 RepID=UPI0037CC877C
MNSQRLAHMRISPLYIQQGLFASLALLVTLIVGQQFERWDNHQEALEIHHQLITAGRSYSTVSAPAAKDTALSFQSAQEVAPVAEQPHSQSWVF